MTHRDFCYWLQGYFEITRIQTMLVGEWNVIVEHLDLTISAVSMHSEGSFTIFVNHLWGFIQINGRQLPGV